MAGDWIKCEHGLTEKPEIIRMAGALGLERFAVAGRWQKVWEWADKNIPQEEIPDSGSAYVKLSPRDGDNIAFIDALVGTPNFANAAHDVGWLNFRNGLIEFPNFGRHNGETAKTRARKARNQKDKRSRVMRSGESKEPETVAGMSPRSGDKSVTRGEERREEINSLSPCQGKRFDLPPAFMGDDVQKALAAWESHYNTMNSPDRFNVLIAAAIAMEASRKGWDGSTLAAAIYKSISVGSRKTIVDLEDRPRPQGGGATPSAGSKKPYTPPMPKERQ